MSLVPTTSTEIDGEACGVPKGIFDGMSFGANFCWVCRKRILQLQVKFKILTDENVDNAVSEQLKKRGVDSSRVIDHLPAGTPDDELLEYAYQHKYSIVTHDKNIRGHIQKRISQDKEHCGVFIAPDELQGKTGIGSIVDYVAEYDAFIKGGAASLQDDVYNQVQYIPTV